MKLNINGEEVTITVNSPYSGGTSEEDTATFLNTLSIYLQQAGSAYEMLGFGAFAKESHTMSRDIFKALSDAGVYDNLE